MSAPIVITGQVLGAESVVARFLSAPDRVRGAVREEVHRLGLELLTRVKRDKLNGQVLRHRTGRLGRSINEQFSENGDSFQSRVGTNLSYARFWEKGFHGPQAIRAHMRRISQAYGRSIPPMTINVSAHTRQVNQPARPFLVPSLEEMRGTIRARLLQAMGRVV